jgi:sigma-54-specific transcriptional regulator
MTAHHYPAQLAHGEYLTAARDSPGESVVAFRDFRGNIPPMRATAFVFADPRSLALQELIERVAPSEATVLITGETGTGKELIARHVHALSKRSGGKFVAINCGAFSETLIESELFGFERGAFTGASQARAGWFETANGGTLFLDEIGDLPLPMQVKLLRVLQEREVVRLGARRAVPIDVRLVAATNVDLAEAVRAGRFREDLYYRLQVISLPLLPLRERPGDLLPLTRHFLQTYVVRLQRQDVELAPEAVLALQQYPWPGNIRELENVIHRALLVCRDGKVTAADLGLAPPCRAAAPPLATNAHAFTPPPWHMVAVQAPEPEPGPASQTERFRTAWQALLDSTESVTFDALQLELVVAAWENNDRNQLRTARYLNISRYVLRAHLKKAGVLH